jgi:hypothetical protein
MEEGGEGKKRNLEGDAASGKEDQSSESNEKRQEEENDGRRSLFRGVVLCAKKNKRKRFFLASKRNDFGGFAVEAVMVDTGRNSTLLPLHEDRLPVLANLFPFGSFFWDVGNSHGVAPKSLTLKISSAVPGNRITINLCSDILRPEKSYEVDFLKFHLCLEDAVAIRGDPSFFDNLLENGRKVIGEFLQAPPAHNGTRRTHALLGQAVLQNLICIQHGSVCLAVEPQHFELTWDKLRLIERFVIGASSDTLTLPDRFDDLEGEDHEGDDEDYCLADDDDLSD